MVVAALVVAAGRGERLRANLPKAFVPLAGRPLVVRAVEAMAACPEVERVVPVVPEAELDRFDRLARDIGPKLGQAVAGGRERQDSVEAGLGALPPEVELVAVHDAARPLVHPRDVTRVVAEARRCGAALLAVPVRDTLKCARDGRVVETPAREALWAAQTPQVFRAELLREALAKARAEGFLATDDAELVERLGVSLRVVEGDPTNFKITWPADLELAEALLTRRGTSGFSQPASDARGDRS